MAHNVGTKVRIMACPEAQEYVGKLGEIRQDNGSFVVVGVKGKRGMRLLMLTHNQFVVVGEK